MTTPKPATLLDWADVYLADKLPHASDSTKRNWRNALTKALWFFRGAATPADLTRANLVAMMRHVARTSGPGAANVVCDKLAAVWRYLHKLGIVDEAPPSPNPRAVNGKSGLIAFPKAKRKPGQPKVPGPGKPQAGVPRCPRPLVTELDGTLWSYFCLAYRKRRLGDASPETICNYEVQFRHFARYLKREPLLSDLREDTVLDVMGYIHSRGDKPRPRTANKFRDCICALWHYLARKRIVEEFPEVKPFREPLRVPRGWTRDQLILIAQACQQQTGTIAGLPAAIWWAALVSVCFYSAERIGALLKIRWCDVDLETGWLLVPAEFRKGRTADKPTRLPASTIALLWQLKREPDDLVFPIDRNPAILWRRLGLMLKSVGLPCGRMDKFHKFRRSSASHFKSRGGDAQSLLGHSDARVTAKYIDPTICVAQQPADVLFGIDAPKLIGGPTA